MFYNYQREYDPAAGRYSQSDPMGFDGGYLPSPMYQLIQCRRLIRSDCWPIAFAWMVEFISTSLFASVLRELLLRL
ncbi:hypothetical protein AYX08_00975 [Stenotrophomonas maltophilia]|nr:hypothetical protein AYX08_00975 [Stenotrophomonas maltophilia]